MKKALAILMILALVGSAAFAEITFGAWGRGVFVPVQNSGATDDDSTATNKASWGGAPRIGFTISGVSDNVGFQADMNVDGGKVSCGDQQKIWVKPVSMLTLTIGNAYDDTLRGNAAFGSFNWDRAMGTWTGDDVTFTRVATSATKTEYKDTEYAAVQKGPYGQGVIAAIKPNDAIYVVAALSDVNGGLTENLFKNIQIAGGYTIDGIGQIRAQYYSAYVPSVTTTDGTVAVAFKLTAVENLYADFGLRMFTNKDRQGETKTISAYANYKIDAATIHGLVIYDLNEEDDGYNIAAGVDYSLDGGIGVAADVRYTNDIKSGGDDATTTFFAGVTKGFSNGKIGAGVEVKSSTDTGYSIPVVFEYWF